MSLRMTEEEYAAMMARRQVDEIAGAMARRAASDPSAAEGGSSPFRGALTPQTQRASSPKRGAKYGNRRVEIDGMKFDSQHEANVYQELALRVKAGELKCVCRQVKFDLPGGIVYIADFVTIGPDMRIEAVIDAKSEATKKNRVYINKKKQMKACWGIDILEV